MVNTKYWDGEDLVDGTAYSGSNQGGVTGKSDAWDDVTIVAPGTVTVNAANKPRIGKNALRYFSNGGTTKARAYHGLTASDTLSARWTFKMGSAPLKAQNIFRFRDSAFSGVCSINLSSAASPIVSILTNGGTTHNMSTALTVGTQYVFKAYAQKGTGANAKFTFKYYLDNGSGSPIDSFEITNGTWTTQLLRAEHGSSDVASQFENYEGMYLHDNTAYAELATPALDPITGAYVRIAGVNTLHQPYLRSSGVWTIANV